jgi:carbon-monoxide dehydrogenase medium subunit
MFAQSFDYYRARSIQEAHKLLAAHPGAKLLAGGHSLLPLLKLRLAAPPAVVDIGRIAELRGITWTGDDVRIGALSTHAELAASVDLKALVPALAEAAAMIGDPAVRNRGTIGGNVAHADPASDLPTVLIALGARMIAASPSGERIIPAEEFFTDIMATALTDDEILVAVQVASCVPGCSDRRCRTRDGERRRMHGCACRHRWPAPERTSRGVGGKGAGWKASRCRDDLGGGEAGHRRPRE